MGGVLEEFLSAVNELDDSDFSIDEASSGGVDVESVSVTFNEEGGVVEETVDTGGVGGQGSDLDGLDGFLSDDLDVFVVLAENDFDDLSELLASLEEVFVVEGLDHASGELEEGFVVLNEVFEVEFSVGQHHVEFSLDDAVGVSEGVSADFEGGEGVNDEFSLSSFISGLALEVVVFTELGE